MYISSLRVVVAVTVAATTPSLINITPVLSIALQQGRLSEGFCFRVVCLEFCFLFRHDFFASPMVVDMATAHHRPMISPPQAPAPASLPRLLPDLNFNDATLFAVYCFIKNFIG